MFKKSNFNYIQSTGNLNFSKLKITFLFVIFGKISTQKYSIFLKRYRYKKITRRNFKEFSFF